ELCLRCLDKDPQERPSAAEVARVLTDLPGVAGVGAAVPDPAEPPYIVEAAQTTFLPRLELTEPVTPDPTSSTRPWRTRVLKPKAIGVAAGVTLAPITALAIFATSSRDTTASATVPSPPGRLVCQATYRIRSDDGSRFTGELTVVNSGQSPLRDW